MRILKRQKGLPFLLALGVLFILSASFLGVQLWSDKQIMRGAVQALEAPVMPPAMPKVVAPPPIKKTAKTQPAKPEVPPAEIKAEPEVAVTEPAPDINAAEVKVVAPVENAPVKEAAPAPVVEQAKPVVVPVEKAEKKEDKKDSAPKKIEKTVSVEKKAEKPVKSTKKAKKARKAVESVPTEIPAEWNWFAQPLKLSFDNGKAVIDRSENDKAISLSSGEKVVAGSPVVADVVVPEEEKQSVEAATIESIEPSVEKPFMLALAKMARIRQMRQQKATGEVDVVEVKPAELSPSLKAIGSKLRELCEKLERRDMSASDSLTASEKTEPVAAADTQVEVADQTTQEASPVTTEATATETVSSEQVATPSADLSLKPYYSGSGSSFSSRINSMLKQGLIRAE